MTQGQIIGRLRKAAHVTQRELAAAVGMKGTGNFSWWENGAVPMPARWFRPFCEALPRLIGQYREEYEAAKAELVAAGEMVEP